MSTDPKTIGDDATLSSPEAGPKRTTSLVARAADLASPERQISLLNEQELDGKGNFEAAIRTAGQAGLHPGELEIFQINLGKLCNMACRHCHVDSGPDRITENMDREMVDHCLAALDKTTAHTVDLTGGAPELNPHFQYLVDACVERGKHVIDRCNLTILLLPRSKGLAEWLGDRGVEIVCSLPHHRKLNTDAQRGDGTHEKSLEALKLLNDVGYGKGDPGKRLTLMSNPGGAYLAGNQAALEAEWKAALERNHGIHFDRLIALNNMPISRYLEWLETSGNLHAYMQRLVAAFNPGTLDGLMCRNTISVSWDGQLYDCDFNQMLAMGIDTPAGKSGHVRDLDAEALSRRRILTGRHCFGCTAGSGSSCGGALISGKACGATPPD